MAESVQQAKIGEVGLGSRTTLLLYLLYKQAHASPCSGGKDWQIEYLKLEMIFVMQILSRKGET